MLHFCMTRGWKALNSPSSYLEKSSAMESQLLAAQQVARSAASQFRCVKSCHCLRESIHILAEHQIGKRVRDCSADLTLLSRQSSCDDRASHSKAGETTADLLVHDS